MSSKPFSWHKVVAVFLVLVLMVPVLAACDDDDDDEKITTMSSDTTADTSPVSEEPIKIGVISAWTGPDAASGFLVDKSIKAAQEYLKERGGILGGRPIDFIKYDGGGQVSKGLSQFIKASLQDDVSIIVGGGTAAEYSAYPTAAENYRVPYVSCGADPTSLKDYPYTIRGGGYNPQLATKMWAQFIVDELKPTTVVFLTDNISTTRSQSDDLSALLQNARIKVIDSIYPDVPTTDYSSYLTKIRYNNPDVLVIIMGTTGGMLSLLQQGVSLGGWGNMKVLDITGVAGYPFMLRMPGMQNTYHEVLYVPGLPYPGAELMDRIYTQVIRAAPSAVDTYWWMMLMAAIAAVDGAQSTDRDEIQQYMRSGNLTYDGPLGTITVGTDGEIDFRGLVAQDVNSQWVLEESTLPE